MTASELPIRSSVRRAGRYRPAARDAVAVLDLDRNEGPGDPRARAWLSEIVPRADARRYPESASLEAAIAEYLGVSPACVLVTAGGDEAIDRCARLVGGRNRRAVFPAPTFEMIPRAAQLAGMRVDSVAWPDDAPFPVDAMRAALGGRPAGRAVLTAVVSPDNPTGRVVPDEMIRALVTYRRDVLTVIDGAYREFAGTPCPTDLLAAGNAVFIGTFSKAFALAGLRVGYAAAAPEVIETLRACGGPFTVGSLSLAAAQEMLRQRPSWIEERIEQVCAEREALSRLLCVAGWYVTASKANFVFARRFDAGIVGRALLDSERVRVRTFSDPSLQDALRITCPGDAPSFDRLLAALRNVGAIRGETTSQTQEQERLA